MDRSYQITNLKNASSIWLLSKIKKFLYKDHRVQFYKSYIQPHGMSYVAILYMIIYVFSVCFFVVFIEVVNIN